MRGRKLLFVDDEPAIRLTLPAILKQEGFDVTAASTVPEALDCINKEKFDVLLSDLNIGQPGDDRDDRTLTILSGCFDLFSLHGRG